MMLVVLARLLLMFCTFERTYSLAPWRHVVCSWPALLPPSASLLSLGGHENMSSCQIQLLDWISFLSLCPEMIEELIIFVESRYQSPPRGFEGLQSSEPRCCDLYSSPGSSKPFFKKEEGWLHYYHYSCSNALNRWHIDVLLLTAGSLAAINPTVGMLNMLYAKSPTVHKYTY